MSGDQQGARPEGTPIHVYDGIEEMDHHLPNWWLGILWGTILFAAGYWMYYAVAGLGPDQRTEYAQEQAALVKRMAASGGPASEEVLLGLARDGATVQAGQAVFGQQCASCHGAQAQGSIGPNLTDAYWLHGGKPLDIQKTVTDGAIEKGMPAWGRTLGSERVRQLTAYLLTLKGTNVAGGKAPQGEPVH
jgi:cytochrome c oxidase cbb3-type subunit 3